MRDREQRTGHHRGIDEAHPLAQQREQDHPEEELFDHGDDARAEHEVDDQSGQRRMARGGDDERLGMRAHDRRLEVRDGDRQQPQADAHGRTELGPDRRGQAEVRRPEPRQGPQQDDQAEPEGEVLPRREDPDLLRGELVEVADRDGECARDREHGHVRKQEGGDGAHEHRPEPPARRLDPGWDGV